MWQYCAVLITYCMPSIQTMFKYNTIGIFQQVSASSFPTLSLKYRASSVWRHLQQECLRRGSLCLHIFVQLIPGHSQIIILSSWILCRWPIYIRRPDLIKIIVCITYYFMPFIVYFYPPASAHDHTVIVVVNMIHNRKLPQSRKL